MLNRSGSFALQAFLFVRLNKQTFLLYVYGNRLMDADYLRSVEFSIKLSDTMICDADHMVKNVEFQVVEGGFSGNIAMLLPGADKRG